MKKIELQGLDLCAYTEKLKNGLEVIMIPFEDKNNYFISYATRYGSEVTTFIDSETNKEITVPDGIAHFLEHKMFEQEDGVDPFSYFSESGTGANAGTYYDYTEYICYGNKNFNDNLEYLISYVNSPYYTDENVEKEKGIIAEELKMYADMPDYKLEQSLREATYKKHPRRIDIGGTIEEINKITKEDLYKCYNNFYSPNNMFILIVGKFDMEKASKIIHKSLDNKENRPKTIIKPVVEDDKINKKETISYADIKLPKIGVGLKLSTKELDKYDDLLLDLYLQMAMSLSFGKSSLFMEDIRERKIVNGFQFGWESIKDIKTLFIMASSKEPDELIKAIKEQLNNLKIKEEDLNRVKKVWIANEIKIADYINNMKENVFDDLIRYGHLIPNRIDIIRSMNVKDINYIISKIDPSNIAVVKLLPKEA